MPDILNITSFGIRRLTRKILLSYNAIFFGRPKGMISIQEIDGHVASWRCVRTAEGWRNGRPRTIGSASVDFTSILDPIPELGVISIPNGSVFGSQGWIFTEDKKFIPEISWHGIHARDGLLPSMFPRPTRLPGKCLVLASEFGDINYSHFLLDCLPRFCLFLESGYTIDDVDYIYIPAPPSASAHRTMIALGIPEDKCIWSHDSAWLKADEIIATSFPGSRRNYARWVPGYLQTILKSAVAKDRQIYVIRRGTRKVINEEQLLTIARKYKIECCDFSGYDEQPELFNECRLIVGVHGAGLANIAFCSPNTKVLELIPSDHKFPYYYTLAEAGRLEYCCLVGDSLAKRPEGSFGPSPYDFYVAPDEFEASLQLLVDCSSF